MSETASDTTPTTTEAQAPAPAAPPPPPAPAPAASSGEPSPHTQAERRAAAAAILARGKPAPSATPKTPPPITPQSAAAAPPDEDEEPIVAPPPKVEAPKPPEPSKPRKPSPFAEHRIAARKLEAERQAAASERAKVAADLEAERQRLASERERVQNAPELRAARHFLQLFADRPDEAIRAAAQMTRQKPEEIMRRIAERSVNGAGADDAQRGVSELERKLTAELAAERAEREKFIAEQKAERERAEQERAQAAAAERERWTLSFADRMTATGRGLDASADEVLQQQAKNLPYSAIYAARRPERVKADSLAIMREAVEYLGRPTNDSETNRLALELESRYRQEYEALYGALPTQKAAPAAPLGSTEQVPGSLTAKPASANGNGVPPRVDIATAAGTGMRRDLTPQERRREAARLIQEGLNKH